MISTIPALLRLLRKAILLDTPCIRWLAQFKFVINRAIRPRYQLIAAELDATLRLAMPQDGDIAKLRRIARGAPFGGEQDVQDGEASGGDGEEEVDDGPAELVLEDPGHVRVLALGKFLADDGGDAGDGADGEEEAEADLCEEGHLHDIEDDEGDAKQGEFEGHVRDAEGELELGVAHAFWGLGRGAIADDVVDDAGGEAVENAEEEGSDYVDGKEDEEGDVGALPADGGKACEAAVEESDGD